MAGLQGLTWQTQQKGPLPLWKRNQKSKTRLLPKGPPHVLQNQGLLGQNLLSGAGELQRVDDVPGHPGRSMNSEYGVCNLSRVEEATGT